MCACSAAGDCTVSVCVCVCRSESATLNIAVNRSLPVPLEGPRVSSTHVAGARGIVWLLTSFKLLLVITLLAACCLISTVSLSTCLLLRRRARRRALACRAHPADVVTSRQDKMAPPLCSNGKVSVIHSSAIDRRENNGHVMMTRFTHTSIHQHFRKMIFLLGRVAV